MAANKLSLRKSKIKLNVTEDSYYLAAADYILRLDGIDNPTHEEITEIRNYLSHTYLGFSTILSASLTEKELNLVYDASRGKGMKESSKESGVLLNRVRKRRQAILDKLNSENICNVVYLLTRLGLLPIKKIRLNLTDKKEVEHAST